MEHFTFQSIGFIESCYPARFGTPRQPGLVPEAWAVLKLRPELSLAEALEGLKSFTHVWVVFVFHKNGSRRAMTKVKPPRLDGRKAGVFATRTPHRPNPIGLSAVRLERIDGNNVYLSGVDFVDGTPVLDLKPYVPFADAIFDAKSEWASAAPPHALRVDVSAAALSELEELRPQDANRVQRLIEQTIQLDPRAGFLKGTAEAPNPYTNRYGFFLENLNVVFRVDGQQATVIKIEPR